MTAPNRLLASLEALTAAHPLARKQLVAPDLNWGRELLATLARRTGGWVGWEVTTLRRLADGLAFVRLHERRVARAGDIALAACVDEALAGAVAGGEVSEAFAALRHGLGFRAAVRDAVLALRAAGLDAEAVRMRAPAAADVAAVLARYGAILERDGAADPARVFALALEAFDEEAPFQLAPVVALAPDLRVAGLPGRLLDLLVAHGARPLAAEPVAGLAPPPDAVPVAPWPADGPPSLLAWLADPSAHPRGDASAWAAAAVTLDGFAAATPLDEVREVLRRVRAEGVAFEQVELVTTDPDTYGVAVEAVAAEVGIEVTALHGVPFHRTRLGRALARWFRWLEEGLPADVLREAIEAGELLLPRAEVPAAVVARFLRELQVGWGRARYDATLQQLADPAFTANVHPHEDETAEERAERIAERGRRAAALHALLVPLLAATPPVPERGTDEPVTTSVPALARAARDLLALLALEGEAERLAAERLRGRLDQFAALPEAPLGFGAALAALRDGLADLRAWTVHPAEGRPWEALPGRVHLTDLAHAGTTGRARTFVLGLDAERAGGARAADPILDDATRLSLDPVALPPTAARLARQRWLLARALAGLRGRVTLSYARSGELAGQEVGPAPAFLQAHRLVTGDLAADYDALRTALGAPACPVPAEGAVPVSVRDAWLAGLWDGRLLGDGERAVVGAFPGLGAGLAAARHRAGPVLTPHHGVVPAAAGVLDPRRTGRAVSPTSLEQLAKCPLAWFYQRGVGLRLPDDPTYDPAEWLDAREFGALMHELYEAFGRALVDRQDRLDDAEAEGELARLVAERLDDWKRRVPPPSEAVFLATADEVRDAARAFLVMERQDAGRRAGARWEHFELAFGGRNGHVALALPGGGTLAVHGFVDRVDRFPGGARRVIDYKTGRASRYRRDPKGGPFNGGRSLQAPVYVLSLEQVLGGRVERFEYRFPTTKGENNVVAYRRDEVEAALPIVEEVLDHAARGAFLPTLDANDCKYCDCRPICRVRESDERWAKVPHSPRARWATATGATLPEYAPMVRRRGAGGDDDA